MENYIVINGKKYKAIDSDKDTCSHCVFQNKCGSIMICEYVFGNIDLSFIETDTPEAN